MEVIAKSTHEKRVQSRRLISIVVSESWQPLFLNLSLTEQIHCLKRLIQPQNARRLKEKFPLILT